MIHIDGVNVNGGTDLHHVLFDVYDVVYGVCMLAGRRGKEARLPSWRRRAKNKREKAERQGIKGCH